MIFGGDYNTKLPEVENVVGRGSPDEVRWDAVSGFGTPTIHHYPLAEDPKQLEMLVSTMGDHEGRPRRETMKGDQEGRP